MNSNINWENKLLSFGIPQDLVDRMVPNLVSIPYDPSQFSSIQQLIPVMESYNFQSLDWYDDLMEWLQYFMDKLMEITPGIILTAVGGAVTYFLRNVKVKNIPIGLVGLIPMSYGIWLIAQPFLPQEGG